MSDFTPHRSDRISISNGQFIEFLFNHVLRRKSLTQNLFDLINGFKLENEFDEMKLPRHRHALASFRCVQQIAAKKDINKMVNYIR